MVVSAHHDDDDVIEKCKEKLWLSKSKRSTCEVITKWDEILEAS